eukprot:1161140-Pelagomonas_calceolata.AAC.20
MEALHMEAKWQQAIHPDACLPAREFAASQGDLLSGLGDALGVTTLAQKKQVLSIENEAKLMMCKVTDRASVPPFYTAHRLVGSLCARLYSCPPMCLIGCQYLSLPHREQQRVVKRASWRTAFHRLVQIQHSCNPPLSQTLDVPKAAQGRVPRAQRRVSDCLTANSTSECSSEQNEYQGISAE